MNQLTVFRVSTTPLAISEVVSILNNPPADGISTLPPVKPKAGRYIYTTVTVQQMVRNYMYTHILMHVEVLISLQSQ